MDDPFVNQTYISGLDGTSSHRPALFPRASVRMPPAVKGTMTSQHRYLSSAGQSHEDSSSQQSGRIRPPSLAGQVSKRPEEYAGARALNDPTAAAKGYVRDPNPYTGFSAPSNKTEMFMQSLEEKLTAGGNGPNTGRTVLYDPVTQGTSRKTSLQTDPTKPTLSNRNLQQPGFGPLNFQHDLLKASDPLPPMANEGENIESVETVRPSNQQASFSPPSELVKDQAQLKTEPYSSNHLIEALTKDSPPLSQEQKDAELIAWFTSKPPTHEYIRTLLEHSNPAALLPNNRPSTPLSHQQRTLPAPIGSGRRSHMHSQSSTSSIIHPSTPAVQPPTTASVAAASTLLAPAIANLHLHALNNPTNPFTRYAPPPAWCVDPSIGGGSGESFFGEEDWNPPPRVGRDKRYPVVIHEGRATYFESFGGGGRIGGRR